MDILYLIECLFSNTWRLLTGFQYPGTGVTVASILVGSMMIMLLIRIFKRILGGMK